MKTVITTLLLVGALGLGSAIAQQQLATQAITEYFDMLETGNLETARMMWTPEAQERSARFGINYTDIPLKIDAGSPIIRRFDVLVHKLYRPVSKQFALDEGKFVRLTYSTLIGQELIAHDYYVKRSGGYYWLCYAQDWYADGWPVQETGYFRIHVQPGAEQWLNPAVLEEADEALAVLAREVGLSQEQIDLIGEEKIEYFFCASDEDVKAITGHSTHGTTDLASNDIISASFPHPHELTHLLVNIKLQSLPLMTLPIMREGVAVHFGGRWGKAPEALMDMGAYLYQFKLIDLDSVLTMPDFQTYTGADISYPVVGLFNRYLYRQLRANRYFDLYRALSGPFETLMAMSSEQIGRIIADAMAMDSFDEVLVDFDRFIVDYLDDHEAAEPGALFTRDTVLVLDGAVVLDKGDWYGFEFAVNGESKQGNLCLQADSRLNGATPSLFVEQYGDTLSFPGMRYGVRFDKNEAGVYDYATNRLLAKYISGISPSTEYVTEDSTRISVKFRKYLFEGGLNGNVAHELLPK